MDQITLIVEQTGVQKSTADELSASFGPIFGQLSEWKTKAVSLVVTDASQATEMKQAREARLALKDIRVSADKRRKELKEDSIRYGRAVQSVYNYIEDEIKPLEEHLLLQENFAKIQQEKAESQLAAARVEELGPYFEFVPANLDFGKMPEDDYRNILSGARLLLAQKQEEEARRREAELAEAARAEAEQVRAAAQAAAERKEILARMDQLKAEAAQREKELAHEREKAQQREKELQAEKDKIRSTQAAARAEAERKEKELSELAAAPDKAKMTAYINQLMLVEKPAVSVGEYLELIKEVQEFLKTMKTKVG